MRTSKVPQKRPGHAPRPMRVPHTPRDAACRAAGVVCQRGRHFAAESISRQWLCPGDVGAENPYPGVA